MRPGAARCREAQPRLRDQLGLPADQLAVWLTDLKHALGCGGTIDGAALVIQGDQRPRVRAWLTTRGVRKLTLG